ncbi:MAG: hypothetical protein ABEJ57_09495 [Halobacteriaceae archaeon]
MDRIAWLGSVCTGLGLVGYGLGVVVGYPGRELAIVAVLVGVTILAIGGGVP